MKFNLPLILIGFCCLFFTNNLKAQGTGIKPQYWNNAAVVWEANENLFIAHALSYNVLIDKELPWSEFSFNNKIAYVFNDLLSTNGGVYIAATKQSTALKSIEIRPYIGFRLSTKMQKRGVISNLSRFEYRYLDYSDNTNNSNFRFRNRTTGALAINKKSILENNTLLIFAYFEAFHNFNEEIVERYFTSFKYKTGIKYRFSYQWRIDAGVLFNHTRNTIEEPAQSPTNVITNFILEWGVTFGIAKR